MTKLTATTHCPECGGHFSAGETCTDRYHACMALELTDSAYGVVHHLTVPAYILQHSSHLSADGWQAMCQILHDFLVAGVSPARMRQLIQKQQKIRPKSFSMVKGAVAAQPTWTWTKTILTVRLDDPTRYCADVRAWAEAVHRDIQQADITGFVRE